MKITQGSLWDNIFGGELHTSERGWVFPDVYPR
jgi:hypothetical protein